MLCALWFSNTALLTGMTRNTWTEGSEGESEEVSGVEDLITEDLELLPIDGLREEVSQHFVGGCVNNGQFTKLVLVVFRWQMERKFPLIT
jgi:hypothetical protein